MNESNTKVLTNADRIKAMTTDELATFLSNKVASSGSFIMMVDHYICSKCKTEHNGHCPINLDDEQCLYDLDVTQSIKYWLEGEVRDE